MTEIEKLSEELAEYSVPDELIGRIENLLANLYAEKERLRIERNWEISPDRMGRWGGVMKSEKRSLSIKEVKELPKTKNVKKIFYR